MSYNIRFGGTGREARLAEVIKAVSPDIVVFQEATDPQVIAALAEDCAMPHWAAKQGHSIGFISRAPIPHHQWHYASGARHGFLEIALTEESRIFGLHLSARFSKWSERRRAREIRALLEGIEKHQGSFHVLVGDFNTLAPGELLDVKRMPAWIRALIWLSGREIQRETIQVMVDAHYRDAYRSLYPDDKGYTFPTWDPHLRLDYFFVPEKFARHLTSSRVINDLPGVANASDHFPLVAELELDTEPPQLQ
jgi:endonuclease/exonuclease/phosphatase family metal-dependent hydrolase